MNEPLSNLLKTQCPMEHSRAHFLPSPVKSKNFLKWKFGYKIKLNKPIHANSEGIQFAMEANEVDWWTNWALPTAPICRCPQGARAVRCSTDLAHAKNF